MKRFLVSLLSALAGLLFSGLKLTAQPPGSPPVRCVPIDSVPPASHGGSPQSFKICISERKPSTKTVYACKPEEFCLPRCSFLALFWGHCACDDGRCGEVRVRHRLVAKKVEGCDTKQCILRE